MKKMFLAIVMFSIMSKPNTVYAQITDTLTYINDSIVAKKANFINKPLSTLFSNLKLPITKYFGQVPFPYLPDTLTIAFVDFSFSDPSKAITRMVQQLPEYNIHVILATPQRIPKKYFDSGQVLDWTTGWNVNKANYLNQFVISDIQ